MSIAERSLNIMHGLLKRFGPADTKKLLWDKEFAGGHWDFIDDTSGDCVYSYLETYSRNGAILDLGCGPGNTANELSEHSYRTYMGVDISDAALSKARKRTEESGRANNTRFELGDFLSYSPSQHVDVILFRESLYHVPLRKVKNMLRRYSQHLRAGGVFIVRLVTSRSDGTKKRRLNAMVHIIENNFEVVEKRQHGNPGPTVIVFRPRL